MAATTFASMSFDAQFNAASSSKNAQCIDPSDLDRFLDFGALPSPSNSKAPLSQSASALTSPTNTAVPLDFNSDEVPIKPSHEYGRFKQQTGLPTGSYASLAGIPEAGPSNTGFGFDASFDSSVFSSSGLGIDTDMGFDMPSASSDMPAYFFPDQTGLQADSFVDPSAITAHDEQPKVRFYPGMHKQQAALAAKAQAQAQQQRQQQMMQQQQKQAEQPQRQGSRKSASPIDARTEETIARVVNQIRKNSAYAAEADSPTNSQGNFSRSRKDDDDMDEDERLLNSEEGKKLSSKERRQLRNKVSARAFRSRRKEYIGQLEGDLNGKANEVNDLKATNRALMEENARFRELTIKLLRHPAFTPFLDDVSRDPALSDSLAKVSSSMSATAAAASEGSSSQASSAASQQMLDVPQQQDLQIGMASIPETQLDFSALNLNGNNGANWGMPNGFGYQPQVFAVTELPAGPAAPLEQPESLSLSAKGEESFIERFAPSSNEDVDAEKVEYPTIETPAVEQQPSEDAVEPVAFDESDATFALYADIPRSSPTAATEPAAWKPIFGAIAPEKALAHISLTIDVDGTSAAALEERLARLAARCDAPFRRLQEMSTQFE